MRVTRGARLALLVALSVACGGKSVLVTGDDASSGGDPSDTGGRPGAGGTGATPAGGTSFTGGTFSGGGVSNGGSSAGGTGAAGRGGTPSLCMDRPPLPPRGEGLTWDSNGTIAWTDSGFGIQGSWYSADDCANIPSGLACTTRDPALYGSDGRFGWATGTSLTCAGGVAPRVALKQDGTYAYAEQWGFLIGFTLNDGRPWNADERCVHGVEFDVAGTAPALLRVNLVTTATPGVAHFVDIAAQGHVALPFALFAQGSWVMTPTPLDTSALTSIELHVFTNTSSSTPFAFCVENVRFHYDTVLDH